MENTSLPIEAGQTISQPVVVARMCELLGRRQPRHVLDVGTGSGYHAAVLGAAGAARRQASSAMRRSRSWRPGGWRAAGADGVELVVGDGTPGLAAGRAVRGDNVAAAARRIPAPLAEQLADGGRLVMPSRGRLVRLRRSGGELVHERFEGVRFVPLVAGE